MRSVIGRLGDISDFGFGLCVLLQLSILIIPLPSTILDFALALSFLSSILILLVSLSIRRPLDFSILPTLLLLTTILRLSLNVATSRLILTQGGEGPSSAGRVVAGFGGFLMGGDVLVGVIIFAILLIVNFSVITKGSSRIAEVSARFYLDSMPGKQMAIDADLSSGVIDESSAQIRRAILAEESSFYGAMDGASKFVRGDAICALVITVVNMAGGLAVGITKYNLSFGDAVARFSTLTIGDGLVSQIPAIFISTAAAIVVSKGAADDKMHGSLSRQLGSNFSALAVTAATACGLALAPNLPALPFLLVSFAVGFLAYRKFKAAGSAPRDRAVIPTSKPKESAGIDPPELLRVELGYGILELAGSDTKQLPEQIRRLRRTVARDLGFVIPPVHIQDNAEIGPYTYSIFIKNICAGSGEVRPSMMLAISPGEQAAIIHGEQTLDPTFGLPATWILPSLADQARLASWTVVDLPTVITTHLAEMVRENVVDLFSYADVQRLLTSLPEENLKLINEIIPGFISYGGLQRLLGALLAEKVSIRDLPSILEAVHEYGQLGSKANHTLLSHVRSRLGRQICDKYLAPAGYIPALVLSTEWEEVLTSSLIGPPEDRQLALRQEELLSLIERIRVVVEEIVSIGEKPVLITSRTTRLHVYSIVDRLRLGVPVLAQTEIHRRAKIRILGTV